MSYTPFKLNINSSGQIADLNSIIWGDVSQPEWTALAPSAVPTIQANYGESLDGFIDTTLINPTLGTAEGVLDQVFSCPPLTTSVSFEIDAMSGPNGANSITIRIMTQNGITTLKSAVILTTGTMTTYTTGALTVSAGNTYRVRIEFNTVSNPSQAIIGKARVRILSSTNTLFQNSFIRYNASPKILWNNNHDELLTDAFIAGDIVYRYQSPMSRMVFETNASIIGIQVLNIMGNYNSGFDQTAIIVNGRPFTTVTGAHSTNGIIDIQNVILPAGLNIVEVITSWGDYIDTPAQPLYSYVAEAFTMGVIVPEEAIFNILPPPQNNGKLMIFGDSKDTGFAASNPSVNGWPALLRKDMVIDIISEAQGSASLYANAATPEVQQSTIARMVQAKPTALLFMHGRNDWTNQTYTPTTYKVAAGAFLDSFHQSLPSASIYVVSTWLESVGQESLTVGGFTLNDFRVAMAAIASERSYCTFIDGTTVSGWSQTTSLYDGIHPNTIGSYQIAKWLAPLLSIPSAIYGALTPDTIAYTGGLVCASADTTPGVSQLSTTNVTTSPLIFSPQVSTNGNGNGSSINIQLSAPTGSGAEGFTRFYRGVTYEAAIGSLDGNAFGGIWLQPELGFETIQYAALFGNTSYTFLGSGTSIFTYINGSPGPLCMNIDGVQLFNGNTFNLGGGVGVLGLTNATTVPTANPTGGGVLYANAGNIYWLGTSGPAVELNNSGSFTAGGDLTGTSSNQTVNAIQGVVITGSPNSTGEVLTISGTNTANWETVPATTWSTQNISVTDGWNDTPTAYSSPSVFFINSSGTPPTAPFSVGILGLSGVFYVYNQTPYSCLFGISSAGSSFDSGVVIQVASGQAIIAFSDGNNVFVSGNSSPVRLNSTNASTGSPYQSADPTGTTFYVDTSSGACSFIPPQTTSGLVFDGQTFTIKDSTGSWATNSLTITAVGSILENPYTYNSSYNIALQPSTGNQLYTGMGTYTTVGGSISLSTAGNCLTFTYGANENTWFITEQLLAD